MPRETVHTDVRPYGDDVPAVSAVEVSWATGGKHVQVGTVLVNADDGLPFQPEPRLAVGWPPAVSGGALVNSGQWPHYPAPSQTIPMVPLPDGTVDMSGWCAECQTGRHTQCLDDNEPDDGRDRCLCPCGEIKVALANEPARLLETWPDVAVNVGGGHFVQLNRKELNELIRKLKRAGRMTFGTDEW